MLGAAVYLPHLRMMLMFLPISIPIRVLTAIIFVFMLFTVLSGLSGFAHGNSMAFAKALSDVCHLGGALAAAGWILLWHYRPNVGQVGHTTNAMITYVKRSAWRRRMEHQARMQQEVDRILQKIHDEGLTSLSGHEKRLLKKATDEQREEDQRVKRL